MPYYGVGDGVGDSSVFFFEGDEDVLALFFFGEADGEADVVDFFDDDDVLVVDFLVEVVAGVLVLVVSVLFEQEITKARPTTSVITERAIFFIDWN